MAFLRISEARSLGADVISDEGGVYSYFQYLRDENRRYEAYDIFLSHSHLDVNLVAGIKKELYERGIVAYVDWIDGTYANNYNYVVTPKTAKDIRNIMKFKCTLMVYLHTQSTRKSSWCPWELGCFDGLKDSSGHFNRKDSVYILPLVDEDEEYQGQEYLGIYPIIEIKNFRPRLRSILKEGAASSSYYDVVGFYPDHPQYGKWSIFDLI